MSYDEVWDLIEYGLIAFAILVYAIDRLHARWQRKREEMMQARLLDRPVEPDDTPMMSRQSPAA